MGVRANPMPFDYQALIVRPAAGEEARAPHRGLADSAGAAVGLRGADQDITEGERTAVDLRASEERYRTLFESNPQPMYVFDLGTLRFLAVNEVAVGHYGYSRDEFLAMTLVDLFPEADRDAVRRSAAQSGRAPGTRRSATWHHGARKADDRWSCRRTA